MNTAAAPTVPAMSDRAQMMIDLKTLLDKHGTEAILGLMTEAIENLASLTQTTAEETRVFGAARRFDRSAKDVLEVEGRTTGTLGDSLEVMLDCEMEGCLPRPLA